MALKVIGAGWGRTGTESLKIALEHLGFNKCYHMFELIKDGERVKYWEILEDGQEPDYEALFKGYEAAVDAPACLYYRQLMETYPDAKVILTVRDPEKWYESAAKTILKGPPRILIPITKILGPFSKRLRYFPRIFRYVDVAFYGRLFQGNRNNKDFLLKTLNAWNAEVKRVVPAHRLLVYEVKDGWEPLCKFLNVPVPSIPFPRSNDSEAFQKRVSLKGILKGEQ